MRLRRFPVDARLNVSRNLRRPRAVAYHRNKENYRPNFFFPENYLEIGNGLPTQKNSVWELFGSVTGIKSVII